MRELYTYKKYKGSRKFRIQDNYYFRARIRKKRKPGVDLIKLLQL